MIVLGNGESRRGLDLSFSNNIKIGCNAIHRDIHVDHLVCVDPAPLKEALASNLKNTTIWTRAEYASRHNAIQLPDVPRGNQRPDHARHWGSGPYAVLLALTMDNTIQMIGFDLYSNNRLVNNFYKDTANYSPSNSHAVDPSYWIYQISRIMQTYSDKYFVVYNIEGWQLPIQWQLDNVVFKTLDTIAECL
jgi:hypothetical protein